MYRLVPELSVAMHTEGGRRPPVRAVGDAVNDIEDGGLAGMEILRWTGWSYHGGAGRATITSLARK